MNYPNFADVITRIIQAAGLLFTAVLLFWGMIYITNGNWMMAVGLSLAAVIFFFFVIDYFIQAKANMNRGGYPAAAKTIILFYVVINIPIAFVAIHTLNVELSEKKEIVAGITSKIKGIEQLQTEYNEITTSILQEREARLNHLFGNLANQVNISSEEQAELMAPPYNFSDKYLEGVNTETKKRSIDDYIKRQRDDFSEAGTQPFKQYNADVAKNIIKEWQRMKINKLDLDLNDNIKEGYGKLSSTINGIVDKAGRTLTFNPNDYTKENLLGKPKQLFMKHLGVTYISIVFFFEIMLIAPWITAPARRYNRN